MVAPSDITVVVPTYRRPKLLARALASVARHGERELRVRVLDNASGDETEDVVRGFARGRHVDYVRHSENIGCSANIQFAINSVDTPYCAILNDDDVQLSGLIESAIRAFESHPSAGAYCGRTLVYDDTAKRSLGVQGRTWEPGFYRAGEATAHMIRDHLTPTALVFRTSALRRAQFVFGDIEMLARLAEESDLVVNDQINGAFAVHPQSWTFAHSMKDNRELVLAKLEALLRLKTLSAEQRHELVLGAVRDLAFREHAESGGALGGSDEAARRAHGRAGLLVQALDENAGMGAQALRALDALITWKAPQPVFRMLVSARENAKRVVGLMRSGAHQVPSPPPTSDAERAAVAEIREIERESKAIV